MTLPLPHLDAESTAVLLIDLHRGHLDSAVATMPVDPAVAERVVGATAQLLAQARALALPTIHAIFESRTIPGLGREGLRNPYRQAFLNSRQERPTYFSGMENHNLAGSPATEAMPGLEVDYEIRTKRRLGSFYGTDLELLLRALRTESLLIAGVNTNTCVLNAAFEAFNRDIRVLVVEDCVASMYGDDLHEFALQNIKRCLGWVVSLTEADELFASPAHSSV